MKIRYACSDDLEIIVDIYNQAIRAGNATANLNEIKANDRLDWFRMHSPDDYPVYIIEDKNEIIGWGCLSPYRQGREALKFTAEISYYLDYKHTGKGYGKKLINFILDDCTRLGIKNVFAILLDVNNTSIYLLEKSGFVKWGYLPRVAELKSATCGQLIYGVNL